MLGRYNALPTLPTSDLARARAFYEKVLGLQPVETDSEGVTYAAGTGRFLVYPSAYAGTNKATSVAFQIPGEEFDAEVERLREAGITLDTFEYEDASWSRGVLTIGDMRGAWFRDPDGNIISVETHPNIA